MNPPTEELTRLLTGAADGIVERDRVTAPEAPVLWRQGRRATWAGRAAAAAIAAALLFLLATGGVALTGISPTVPAAGGTLTYPTVVSDMFLPALPSTTGRLFGLVTATPTTAQPDDTLAIQRRGEVASLRSANPSSSEPVVLSHDGAPVLSPDGRRILTADGVHELADGAAVPPVPSYPDIPERTGVNEVWSPDSRHVLLSTTAGPAVTNGYADVAFAPGPGDAAVLAAGWRGNGTVLGVRPGSGGRLDIVSRTLTGVRWSTVATVATDAVSGVSSGATLSRAYASPGGARLLLVFGDPAPARAVMVDAGTGARVPFAGGSGPAAVTWDACTPVWQAGQPLLANAGLRQPATGRSVMRFSGHADHGCVSLAGNELTGSPSPGAAGAWRERAWQLWNAALPVGGVLVLAGTIWMVVALRRSRRHGEDFLPMVLGRLF